MTVLADSATSIEQRLSDGEVAPGLRLITLPMGIQDVVTIVGSFYGGDIFSPTENQATADVTVAMLDKGTRSRDKFEIGALLEAVGAAVRFSSDDFRVNFSARCLKSDLPLVIELLAEQLMEPAFHEEDLASLKKRILGNLKRQLESTDEQARIAFSQLLYGPRHPNYIPGIESQIAEVEALTIEDLAAFYRQHYGRGSIALVATGDLDRAELEQHLAAQLGSWSQVDIAPPSLDDRRADLTAPGREKFVTLQEKTSVNLLLGMAVGIDREHPDYLPLVVATFILGGNFSARLMTTVRDKAGLTYGIGSSIGGAGEGKDGFWAIHGTFAPPLLATGQAATLEQLDLWLGDGVIAEELAAKKTTITGSYQVGLASTKGMAGAILNVVERGRDLSYLDTYPDEIRALELDQVNGVIGRYLDRDRLVLVAAGSIDEKGEPLAAAS